MIFFSAPESNATQMQTGDNKVCMVFFSATESNATQMQSGDSKVLNFDHIKYACTFLIASCINLTQLDSSYMKLQVRRGNFF